MMITALIVTWNSAADLPNCLTSLPGGVAALVVDNASRDRSSDVARENGATIIALDSNVGFAAAVNIGLTSVQTPFVALINPDVVVEPGAIERCIRELEEHPDVGIVGPNTLTEAGRPEPPAARHDRSALHIAIESTGLVVLNRRFDLQMIHDRSWDRDVDAVNGAFMVMRTELLRELGGLDESVFLYLEDQDLCRRVRDAGYRVRFVADAHAMHRHGTSTGRGDEVQQARAYLHRIDADLEFLRRYGRRWEVPLALAAYLLRSLIGLIVAIVRPERRTRYRRALTYTLRQVRGRQPAPPV